MSRIIVSGRPYEASDPINLRHLPGAERKKARRVIKRLSETRHYSQTNFYRKSSTGYVGFAVGNHYIIVGKPAKDACPEDGTDNVFAEAALLCAMHIKEYGKQLHKNGGASFDEPYADSATSKSVAPSPPEPAYTKRSDRRFTAREVSIAYDIPEGTIRDQMNPDRPGINLPTVRDGQRVFILDTDVFHNWVASKKPDAELPRATIEKNEPAVESPTNTDGDLFAAASLEGEAMKARARAAELRQAGSGNDDKIREHRDRLLIIDEKLQLLRDEKARRTALIQELEAAPNAQADKLDAVADELQQKAEQIRSAIYSTL